MCRSEVFSWYKYINRMNNPVAYEAAQQHGVLLVARRAEPIFPLGQLRWDGVVLRLGLEPF